MRMKLYTSRALSVCGLVCPNISSYITRQTCETVSQAWTSYVPYGTLVYIPGDAALPSVELIPQPQMSSASNDTITTGPQNQTSNESSAVALLTVDQSMTGTLVLLAVRLKDAEPMPNLVSWQNWCHNLARTTSNLSMHLDDYKYVTWSDWKHTSSATQPSY
jgi:hypothetical protein